MAANSCYSYFLGKEVNQKQVHQGSAPKTPQCNRAYIQQSM